MADGRPPVATESRAEDHSTERGAIGGEPEAAIWNKASHVVHEVIHFLFMLSVLPRSNCSCNSTILIKNSFSMKDLNAPAKINHLKRPYV